MPDTPDSRNRPQASKDRRETQVSARTPRMMRRELFDLPSWSLMRRMQENFDRLFGRHEWPSFLSEGEHSDWTPAIETFQRGNEFIIRAEVPGLSRQDLNIEIDDDALTITGERTYDHDEERDGMYRSERAYGSFRRVISLPEGALAESAKASFKDGMLEIRVQAPPRSVRQGRRVEIGEGSPQGPNR